jgi:hypothetical protein
MGSSVVDTLQSLEEGIKEPVCCCSCCACCGATALRPLQLPPPQLLQGFFVSYGGVGSDSGCCSESSWIVAGMESHLRAMRAAAEKANAAATAAFYRQVIDVHTDG